MTAGADSSGWVGQNPQTQWEFPQSPTLAERNSSPVNLLWIDNDKYVVAPRGNAGWVRNAKASGEIWLKKGRRREHFYVKEIGDEHKPLLLKAYLEQFHTTVQRYFPVPAGSDAAAFVAIAPRYPVFKLERAQG